MIEYKRAISEITENEELKKYFDRLVLAFKHDDKLAMQEMLLMIYATNKNGLLDFKKFLESELAKSTEIPKPVSKPTKLVTKPVTVSAEKSNPKASPNRDAFQHISKHKEVKNPSHKPFEHLRRLGNAGHNLS